MSSSRTPSWRTGVVTALVAGSPPQVTVSVGGDTTTAANLPYLDSYDPQVGDTVQLLVNQGAALALGRTAVGLQRAVAQSTTAVSGITTTQVDLLVAPALISDGTLTFRAMFSYDTIASAVANDRVGIRIRRSINGGAFADIARMVPRGVVAASNDGGGTLMVTDPATTVGSYVYKATARLEVGTGPSTVDAGAGRAMTLTVERFLP